MYKFKLISVLLKISVIGIVVLIVGETYTNYEVHNILTFCHALILGGIIGIILSIIPKA